MHRVAVLLAVLIVGLSFFLASNYDSPNEPQLSQQQILAQLQATQDSQDDERTSQTPPAQPQLADAPLPATGPGYLVALYVTTTGIAAFAWRSHMLQKVNAR